MEWSISNSYTIASQGSSYVTLNLYASTGNGTEDIVAPYNITILNPAYIDAFTWNFEVSSAACTYSKSEGIGACSPQIVFLYYFHVHLY